MTAWKTGDSTLSNESFVSHKFRVGMNCFAISAIDVDVLTKTTRRKMSDERGYGCNTIKRITPCTVRSVADLFKKLKAANLMTARPFWYEQMKLMTEI